MHDSRPTEDFARLLSMSSLGGEEALRDRILGRSELLAFREGDATSPRVMSHQIPTAKRRENARAMVAVAAACS